MKLFSFFIFIILGLQSNAQQENLTKIFFKVAADCSCNIQFARNDKPAGHPFKMTSDSFKIAIDSATTGFYITCGKGATAYVKIPYRPGEGYFKIFGKMHCDKKGKNEITIEPIKI
jgi:hypothetical protein